MTSQAKISANRRNARKSRGPRTAAGKSNASRNAYRHGLAAITRHRPALFPEIELMAKALCGDDKNPFLFEQARIIAENQWILQCVCAERVALIERLHVRTVRPLMPDTRLQRARAHFRLAKAKYQQLVEATAASPTANPGAAADASPQTKEGSTSQAENRLPSRYQPATAIRAEESASMELLDEFTAMLRATPDLIRLERYEKRAWSRRKRGIQTFTNIEAQRDC